MNPREKKSVFVQLALALVGAMLLPQFAQASDAITVVRDALSLSARDKLILGETRDGTGSVEEAGFYLLMGKLAKLPQLSPAQVAQLDAPAHANLLARPGRYRFELIKIAVRIFRVEKLTVDEQKISASPYWPSDRPIWALYGLAGRDQNQPVIIYSTVPPPDMPSPSKVLRDGQLEFQKPLSYELCGAFFKFIVKADRSRKLLRKYPVVLAWQLSPSEATEPGSSVTGPLRGGIILLAIVLGLAVLIFLKRKLRKSPSRRAGAFGNYRPLRHEPPAEPSQADADGPGEIDPSLTRAANDYRKEQEQKPS